MLVVSSAETVVHGGPGALLAACDARTVRRAAAARSLVQASGEPVWELALAVEAGVSARSRLFGVSLVLDHPRLTGRFRGYPHEPASLEHMATSPFRRLYSLLPAPCGAGSCATRAGRSLRRPRSPAGRRSRTSRLSSGRSSSAAFAWTSRSTPSSWGCRGRARTSRASPSTRSRPPAIALGHALRQWRDAFPIARGRNARPRPLAHAHPSRTAHKRRTARCSTSSVPEDRRTTPRGRRPRDERALDAYRAGRACHPLLPYADWAGCQPALSRLGRVIVAGSRDAVAARALGFVPSHSIVERARDGARRRGTARARVGILLAPPIRAARASAASLVRPG